MRLVGRICESLLAMIPGEMDFCLLFLPLDLIESTESYLLQKALRESRYDVRIVNEKSVIAVDKIEDV